MFYTMAMSAFRLRLLVGAVLLVPCVAAAGPELAIDVPRLAASVTVENVIFHPPGPRVRFDAIAPVSGNCALDPSEACVGGPGIRRLLRFDALVHNRGDEDLVIGNPTELPQLFEFSECHGHFHFAQASVYELLDDEGNLVTPGRKQGFCLEDTTRSSSSTRTPRRYHCDYQGLQVGWGDLYPRQLDCQWIDVTDVPAGDYTLRVHWNPDGLLPDDDPSNDEVFVPVTLEPPESDAPKIERIWRPRAGSVYTAGRSLFVQWSPSDDQAIASQEVWISLDDGLTWEQLVGDLDGEETWFAWTIPAGTYARRARIRIVARDFETQRGEVVSGAFGIRSFRRVGGVRRLPVRPR